jgi:hypothetical protein
MPIPILIAVTSNHRHIVKWTGRRGIKVVAETYCKQVVSAADGVMQVPASQPDICKACREAAERGA